MLGFIVFIPENCSSCNRSSCKCSYDICDVEHYYNTLHRNYTIAELILLHISRQTILLTLLKLFSVVFYV